MEDQASGQSRIRDEMEEPKEEGEGQTMVTDRRVLVGLCYFVFQLSGCVQSAGRTQPFSLLSLLPLLCHTPSLMRGPWTYSTFLSLRFRGPVWLPLEEDWVPFGNSFLVLS